MKIPLTVFALAVTASNAFSSGEIRISAQSISKHNYEIAPVLLEVKLTNTKKETELVDLGWDLKGDIKIVSRGNTHSYSALPKNGLKFSGQTEIPPGGSMRTVIILNDWMKMESGDYKIEVAIADRPDLISAETSISVQKAALSDLSSLVNELVDLAQGEKDLMLKNEYLDALLRMYEISASAKQMITEILSATKFSKLAEELNHYMKLKESQKQAID